MHADVFLDARRPNNDSIRYVLIRPKIPASQLAKSPLRSRFITRTEDRAGLSSAAAVLTIS